MNISPPKEEVVKYYLFHLEELLLRRKLQHFNENNKTLFVFSAFPKSGSKHLLHLIKNTLPGAKKILAKQYDGFGHNFIDPHRLLTRIKPHSNNLLYGHYPCNGPNKDILRQFAACKVIVGIRPLPDVIISYKEHIEERSTGPLDYGIHGVSECYPEFHRVDDTNKFDYILKFVMPWYVRFVYTWIQARANFPVKFITFEEQTQYPQDTILKIGRFFDIPMDSAHAGRLRLDKKTINFNRGVVGRGTGLLTEDQVSDLNELVCFFDVLREQKLGRYLVHGYDKEAFSPKDVVNEDVELV